MKNFVFGLILGWLIVFGYFFVKENPENIYVISVKTQIQKLFPVWTGTNDITTLVNPASLHCIAQSWTLNITDTGSGQVGICSFADGSSCEEWALLRGECTPGTWTDTALLPLDKSAAGDTTVTTQSLEDWASEIVKEDDEPKICTKEYIPVCAEVQVQCIKAPCPPIKQTFGNKCTMNANKLAKFLYEWECKTE
jgi:putative hemolysin